MSKIRVLISDKMSNQASTVFAERGIEVVSSPKLSEDEINELICDFDGLAVRSSTKVTSKLLASAPRLKVVGRAGIGVDNIDVNACSEKGVVVMNTPFGNAVTTAEHSLAMMFSLARHIPQANISTHKGLWEKSKFMGSELSGKLLGIVGAGNIGSIVAKKALGVGLRVQAYDPLLTTERAESIGIRKVDLDVLLETSDIVSLHVPKTPDTTNIIDGAALNRMKSDSILINCARGGLVDESALASALKENRLRGAALDVFEDEPARENALFGLPNVICTPHLGASTQEAQEKVAIQIAEQISEYLLEGAIRNALNAPNLTAEEAVQLGPYLTLAEKLGTFAAHLLDTSLRAITVTFNGDITKLNLEPIMTKVVQSVLGRSMESINAVNAQLVARDLGIEVTMSRNESETEYHNRISVTLATEQNSYSVEGTLYRKHDRLVSVNGIKLESEFGEYMLYITNLDKPGVIGAVGSFAANEGINIANMHLGRTEYGCEANGILELDAPITAEQLSTLHQLEHVKSAFFLRFSESGSR